MSDTSLQGNIMTIRELSILLPSYNNDCRPLLDILCKQARDLADKEAKIEIVVYDDCSTIRQKAIANKEYCDGAPLCRFIQGTPNVGRSAARNRLAREARYTWLLFIDSDLLPLNSDFIATYMTTDATDAVVGGLSIPDAGKTMRANLRYIYEKKAAEKQTAARREKAPYAAFHVSNLLVRRSIMIAHPFDETISRYGYEDVLLGKLLQHDGVRVRHIDNPVCFSIFDNNETFLKKTEEGLRTLHDMRDKLRGYSGIQMLVERLSHLGLKWAVRMEHRLIGQLLRRWLIGNAPSLTAFLIYRVGFYASIDEKEIKANN